MSRTPLKGSEQLPKAGQLIASAEARALCLRKFAHHEVCAIELFAWALLRFPDAPVGFRLGLLQTLVEEQVHCKLYLERVADITRADGREDLPQSELEPFPLGRAPLPNSLWKGLGAIRASPEPLAAFLCGVGLTFEAANLDHSLKFRDIFRQAGDDASAAGGGELSEAEVIAGESPLQTLCAEKHIECISVDMQFLHSLHKFVTGITGYAGGKDNGGSVCYDNYGKKGHTEVVFMRAPRDKLPSIAQAAWSGLFNDGERQDLANKGSPYRAAIGFRGGKFGSPELAKVFDDVAGGQASLEAGSGNEEDTLKQRRLLVYDMDTFPFHQAELYHQFHDYQGGWRNQLQGDGRLHDVDCPNELVAMLKSPVVIALISGIGFCCLVCAASFGWKYFQQKFRRNGQTPLP
ncbi:unnamed protein product [Polarella glacialis]|uniref:Peptide-methionine (S)-S-oxide reductase n=1 Tax=Polarella glacialis TaxID=89957 RepID=A0A813LT35_POLGL|nr:unnamed protein product [Polarella glacialis]